MGRRPVNEVAIAKSVGNGTRTTRMPSRITTRMWLSPFATGIQATNRIGAGNGGFARYEKAWLLSYVSKDNVFNVYFVVVEPSETGLKSLKHQRKSFCVRLKRWMRSPPYWGSCRLLSRPLESRHRRNEIEIREEVVLSQDNV